MFENYGEVIANASLKNYNTYKIESFCKYLILINNVQKLKILINYLDKENQKYFIIGNGSNIILPAYYDGIIIKLDFNEIKFDKNLIEVGASYMINKLAFESVQKDLKGLEWASGIPGTIGGSVFVNASAYNGDLMNVVNKIEVLEDGKVTTITPKDFIYSYHYTSLKDRNLIILKVFLKLESGNGEELMKIIKDRNRRRITTQPLEYPSAGSVFRNPERDFAGRLIEEAGLKDKTIGGAKISGKHANFIINYNNATSSDIINLIKEIHKTILEKYHLDLILEQEIVI